MDKVKQMFTPKRYLTAAMTAASVFLVAPVFAQTGASGAAGTTNGAAGAGMAGGATAGTAGAADTAGTAGTAGRAGGMTAGAGMASGMAAQLDQQTIRDMQQALRDRGHEVGPIDGMWGQQTQSALREFQQAQGMQASGEPDQQTMSALGVMTSPAGGQTGMGGTPGATGGATGGTTGGTPSTTN